MNKLSVVGSGRNGMKLRPKQQVIRDRCFHPTGMFVEYPLEVVEPPIRARAGKMVGMYSQRHMLQRDDCTRRYDELNGCAHRFGRAIPANRHQASLII